MSKRSTKAEQGEGRRLLLLRHAKSAWPDGVPDHERPLAERGQRAGPRMARYMAQENLLPDLALVSDAKRTQETWALVEKEWKRTQMRLVPELYDASADEILDVLRISPPEVGTVLILGHNPVFRIWP